MNYLYRATILFFIHLMILFGLGNLLANETATFSESTSAVTVIFSLFYIVWGYRAYKTELKIGGVLFIIIGCTGILLSLGTFLFGGGRLVGG